MGQGFLGVKKVYAKIKKFPLLNSPFLFSLSISCPLCPLLHHPAIPCLLLIILFLTLGVYFLSVSLMSVVVDIIVKSVEAGLGLNPWIWVGRPAC